jgi:crossover junction endodeoxyribonuclease RuvC
MSVLGLDPGWSGGVALLDDFGAVAEYHGFATMTESEIIEVVTRMVSHSSVCYIEKVHSMPRQGVASSFKFGMIYGLLRGLIVGRVRMIEVTPQAWQKSLGCLTKGDKNISKAKAQQLFPGIKITHATADALCISYFGWQKEKFGEGK